MAKKFLLELTVCLCLSIGTNAWAATFGDYEYSETAGEIMITDYTGPGGDIVIPDTIDSMPVVGIFDYAFYNSSGLTGVTIPASVNSIGFSVFESCTNLAGITVDENNLYYSSLDGILYNKDKTELIICPEGKAGTIAIPGSVAFIGDSAFYSCTELTGVTIPDSVVSIGNYAFHYCTGLTSITIPDSVMTIGGASFLLCTGLIEVTIGDGLDGIGDYAFDSCISLTSLTIGSNVAIIGREAFNNCRSLTTVSIPASVTDIHDYAFLKCVNLSVVYFLGNAPSTMGESVFYSCDTFEPDCDPTTPDICYTPEATGFTTPIWEATPWESYPAAPCACSADTDCEDGEICNNGQCVEPPLDFNYTVSDGQATITGYTGAGGAVAIPDTIDGFPVVAIGEMAFMNCTALTSITIPDTVSSIAWQAFAGCINLTGITIPDSVTSIESAVFAYCTSLTSITIPDSVTSINTPFFATCSNLTDIIVDTNNPIYSSQDGVLYNKEKSVLVSYPGGKSGEFSIPDSVTSIDGAAFWECNTLTSIVMPNSVTTIGVNAFGSCRNLTSVTIPNGVASIGNWAFAHCSALTNATIGNGVTLISDEAFLGCSALSVASFLGNAPTIGFDVFTGTAPDFKVCFTPEATGFTTTTWYGYPASNCACSDDTDCAEGEMCSDGTCEIDIDFDSIINADDNCPSVSNANQQDVDIDGVGDVCDADTVYGYVYESGAALANVTVRIYQSSCGGDIELDSTTTNSNGYYAFGNIGTGIRTILSEETGYTFEANYVTIPQEQVRSYDFTGSAN